MPNYAAHIRELTEQYNIDHRTPSSLDWRRSQSWPDRREVITPPVKSATVYWIALHEIGHVVRGHRAPSLSEGLFGASARTLQSEAEAWEWALDHTLVAPGPAVAKVVRFALPSYWDNRDPSVTTKPALFAEVERRLLTPRPRPAGPANPHRDQLALAV